MLDFLNPCQGTIITLKVRPEPVNTGAFRDTLASYLTRSCGELGWIENAGLCRSLQAKLENVERQLNQGNTAAPSGRL